MATTQVSTSVLKDGSVTSAKLDTNIAITGNLIVDTNTLYVNSSTNNVGIGTDIPDFTLDISNSTFGNQLRLHRSSVASGGFLTLSANDSVGNKQDYAKIGAIVESATSGSEDGALVFQTSLNAVLTERMRINSGGDISFRDTSNNEAFYWDASAASLGIGTGSSPSAKLDIQGDGIFYSTSSTNDLEIRAGLASTTDGTASLTLRPLSSSTGTSYARAEITSVSPSAGDADLILKTTTDSSGPQERMRIDSSGNVGIGTASTIAKAHIQGGDIIASLTDWNTKSNTAFSLANPAVRIGVGYNASDIPLIQGFDTVNGARNIGLQVYGGNVGIGTASPSEILHVQSLQTTAASNAYVNIFSGHQAAGGGDITGEAGIIFKHYSGSSVYKRAGAIVSARENNYSTDNFADSYLRFETTKDNVDTERMRITSAGAIHLSQGSGNAFVGTDAGNLGTSTGINNSAFGLSALSSNTTGVNNTAGGYSALFNNTTGGFNTATGYTALYSNTTGSYNTANGFAALRQNTTGTYNTAIGLDSLQYNTTGSNNTANGHAALRNNTTGLDNTASGRSALYSNTTGTYNTANGTYALNANTTGANNTASGFSSLYINTTGTNNSAFGESALYSNTTASNNTANGAYALYSNTTGTQNTANGTYALYYNTTASNNTANGYSALYFNTTGTRNTASGYAALYQNTEGDYNTATGYTALYNNTTGSYNTATGYGGLNSNTTGVFNTATGRNALFANTTGESNTAIGYAALGNNTTGSNNTGIGYGAQLSSATVSNEFILGNSAVTTLICNTQTITALSDIRDKKDIKELQGAEEFIKELKPVSFVWNQRDGGRVDIDDNGFIAQDLIEAQEKSGHKIPNLVLENNPEKLQAAYGAMLPSMVSALQSALKKIELLETEIETLKNK